MFNELLNLLLKEGFKGVGGAMVKRLFKSESPPSVQIYAEQVHVTLQQPSPEQRSTSIAMPPTITIEHNPRPSSRHTAKSLPNPSLPSKTTDSHIPPFTFNGDNGSIAIDSIAQCLQVCDHHRGPALKHFKAGHFEPWFRHQGLINLADSVQRIREKKENDKEQLAYFINACWNSNHTSIRDPFKINSRKVSTLRELATACVDFQKDGIRHLRRGDFEIWFKDNNLVALAKQTEIIRRRAEGDTVRLEYFIQRLRFYLDN